jgi:hypothetical protein
MIDAGSKGYFTLVSPLGNQFKEKSDHIINNNKTVTNLPAVMSPTNAAFNYFRTIRASPNVAFGSKFGQTLSPTGSP